MTSVLNDIDFESSVKKRLGMYIGNDHVLGLFTGLISDCIDICKTEEIRFTIRILADNQFSLGVFSEKNITPFVDGFHQSVSLGNMLFHVLKIVSKVFEIKHINENEVLVNFELDTSIVNNTSIDYHELCEKVMLLAILHRNAEIITKDLRRRFNNENYFHFPLGVFYLLDRLVKKDLCKPVFKVRYDGFIQETHYQIGIVYCTHWSPKPTILSFANENNTTRGGSLVNGILDGLTSGYRLYAKNNGLTDLTIAKKEVYNGLILVCAVKGEDFVYSGSYFKETLENDEVKSQAKKLVAKLAYDGLMENKEFANDFILRFNKKT